MYNTLSKESVFFFGQTLKFNGNIHEDNGIVDKNIDDDDENYKKVTIENM